jgi:hypothetical protein
MIRKSILITLTLLLFGCNMNAFSVTACRQAVVDDVGTSDVFAIPGKSYTFVARDKNGAVWIVETLSGDGAKVTSKTMMFAAR